MKCSGRSNRQIDIEQSMVRDIRNAKFILKFIHTRRLKIIRKSSENVLKLA